MQLDDVQSLRVKLDERSSDLFKAKPGVAQLSVSRYGRKSEDGIERRTCFARNVEIQDSDQIAAFRHDPDSLLQIYTARQDRSWTTLNSSREIFQKLLTEYNVFPQFWKCVFTFGRKTEENEFEFPGFRVRNTVTSEPNAQAEQSEVTGK